MNPQNSPAPSASAEGSGQSGGATENAGALTETKKQIAQTAREAATKIKSAAGNTAQRAKEEAERIASEKKRSAAERIGSYGSALNETADSLEDKDPNIAWFAHRAAEKLERAADYVRQRDFGALKHDAEDIARRHPAVFFGGMFLAGLLAGNLVKASRRKLEDRDDESDYTTDWMRGANEDEMQPTALSDAERAAAGI